MPGGREKINCQMPGGREFFLCKCPGVSRGGMVRVGIERDIIGLSTIDWRVRRVPQDGVPHY